MSTLLLMRDNMEYLAQWNAWLGKRMFLIILLALGFGFMVQNAQFPGVTWLVMALYAYMTFVTALETSLKQFINVLGKPWIPIWILILVHVITPILSWGVGYVFFPEDFDIRLGYLISASLPVGVTSIIWTSLLRGNVSISLVTVTVDTIIAPIILPLLFMLVIGQAIQVDYLKMLLQLLGIITLPTIAGMLLHDYAEGKVAFFVRGLGGLTSKLALFLVIFFNAVAVAPMIAWNLSLIKMMLVTLFLVQASYLLGYFGGLSLKERSREITVAIVYNVGLRNISVGLILVLTNFSPAVSVPITLFILFQQPLASLVPYLLKCTKGQT